MTVDSGSVIRALTNQNNELSVLIRDALISTGNKAPDQRNAGVREYVKSLINAHMRQFRVNRAEAAQERIKDRTVFIRAGKRFFRLDAITHIEFGKNYQKGKGVISARIYLIGGDEFTISGAPAGNLFSIMEKTTGDSYYDIHHLVDVSFARSVEKGTERGYEHKESSEDNELHSADGELGAPESGGEPA